MSYETVLNGKIDGGGTGSGTSGSGIFSIEEVCYHQWLQDYKTYGENSSTYKRPDVWESFITSPVAIYDKDVSQVALNHVLNENGHLGKYIGSLNGIGTANWSSLPTLESIYEDDDAFDAVLDHTDAFELLYPLNNCSIINYANMKLINKINANAAYKNKLISVSTVIQSTSSYTGLCLLTYLDDGKNSASNWYTISAGGSDHNVNVWAYVSGTVKYTNLNDTVVTVYTKRYADTQKANWDSNDFGLRSTVPNIFVKKIELIPETDVNNVDGVGSTTVTAYPKAKYIPITLYR